MNKKKRYPSLLLLAILLISLYGKNLAPSDTAGSGMQPTATVTVTETTTDSKASPTAQPDESTTAVTQTTYTFRNAEFLQEHFDKHGDEFDYATAEEYQAGASRVINDEDVLHKLEKEDGDDIYYLESTNELVIVSTDGYIRTYFKPDGGKKYFEKQ